jgi:predicted dehydrogenase
MLGAIAGLAPLIRVQGKPRVYNIALVGTGWWGMNILNTAIAHGQVKRISLCDVDENQLVPARQGIEQRTGKRPAVYRDFREQINSEKPDITIVATPDHWHALPAIEALRSGSHVYLEKPVGHTIEEGKALVAAQKKYGGTIQVGLHRRVSPHNVSGMQFLHSGRVGDIRMVKAFVNYRTGKPQTTDSVQPPAGLDWDMWIGPAPYRPFNTAIHPRGFRKFLDFANGTCADWGVHWFDQVLWWSEDKHPRRITSAGGQLYENSVYDAPDFQVVTFEFGDFIVQWEHRQLSGTRNEQHNIGVYFYGTKGIFHMGWLDGWTFYPNDTDQQIIHEDPALHMPDHQNIPELWANLISCIENDTRPAADIEQSHYATNMGLLAMISQKTGSTVVWDGNQQQIVGNESAAALMRRAYRDPWKFPTPANV